jgi:hypothetical protein
MTIPATDFSATFVEAFGDKEWAVTARQDPVVQVSLKPTLGSVVSMVASCDTVARQALSLDVHLLAIHAIRDCRTECQAVVQLVDQVGPRLAEGMWLENTTGYQLL